MTDASKKRRERFVVLPGSGIAAPAMSAGIFTDDSTIKPFDRVRQQIARVTRLDSGTPFANAVPAGTALADAFGDADLQVESKIFSDGPAIVRMSSAARLAFECANPSLRVLPVTRYHLPGRSARARGATTFPTASNARQADGKVFADDFKQHVLATAGMPKESGQGEGVRVAIVDTGVDADHPALDGVVTVLRCTVPRARDRHDGKPVDWGTKGAAAAGHGTHVAGIIAGAEGRDGPAGIAPKAKLASYRVFPDNPRAVTGAENIAIIDAIRYAIDDGCHIVNLSIEGPNLREDGVRTAISDAWERGIVCIAAAGNGFGRSVSYPAALPHCVAVTAVGRDGHFPKTDEFQCHCSHHRSKHDGRVFLASFSNYGPVVQFAAPGHCIVSAFPNGEWWFQSGTSMAAPFVSGILARALSRSANILTMNADAARSDAMLQLLVSRATKLGLPQSAHEGYGLPL